MPHIGPMAVPLPTRASTTLAVALLVVTSSLWMASAFASNSECSAIPNNLAVPEGLQQTATASAPISWQKGPMVPLDLKFGQVTAQSSISVSTMLAQHTQAVGAVALVVRRPGWYFCREEGQAIARLAAEHPDLFGGAFGLFGIVKEIGVDDDGLLEFYNDYFPRPLYLDQELQFYQAMGNRKIYQLPSWNPIAIWRGIKASGKRIKEKNLTGNMIGEGIVQGGIIIFDQQGSVRAVYKEVTGEEIPETDILAALNALKAEAEPSATTESASS